MQIRERLLRLGYTGVPVKSALIAFQRDFNISKSNKLNRLTIPRLHELTTGNVRQNLLARIIYSESRGEPYQGMIAVGAVVLNRLKSPQFPKTITGVITQPLAFTVISNGRFWLKPSSLAYQAARAALRGIDPSDGCLYFFNPDKSTSKWIWRLVPKLRIGHHVFAKLLRVA